MKYGDIVTEKGLGVRLVDPNSPEALGENLLPAGGISEAEGCSPLHREHTAGCMAKPRHRHDPGIPPREYRARGSHPHLASELDSAWPS